MSKKDVGVAVNNQVNNDFQEQIIEFDVKIFPKESRLLCLDIFFSELVGGTSLEETTLNSLDEMGVTINATDIIEVCHRVRLWNAEKVIIKKSKKNTEDIVSFVCKNRKNTLYKKCTKSFPWRINKFDQLYSFSQIFCAVFETSISWTSPINI